MKTKHTPGPFTDCGEGTLLHPSSHRPITTRVIEAKGWGRIAEVYDYSNESEDNFRLLLAAPKMLSACRAVVAAWEHGDLAAAARACADAIAKAEGTQ